MRLHRIRIEAFGPFPDVVELDFDELGEAGLFLDPFYSPGSDFIAIGNTYICDLIRRDQRDVVDEERWLRDLDASIERGIAEMDAGGGRDLDEVCEELLADIRVPAAARSR